MHGFVFSKGVILNFYIKDIEQVLGDECQIKWLTECYHSFGMI